MSTEHRKRIFNYRTESGKAPDPANIAYGEIAINYKGGSEAIYIKNSADEVVDFVRGSFENISYANLKTLRDEGKLVPSRYYRITDFVTTVAVNSNSRSAGHPFDLIVLAIAPNVLHEKCYAIQHEGDEYFKNCKLTSWEVWYCLDNDTTKYAWADTTNGKGVIYRMIDEWQNDCPYDFKNVQFKRYYTSGLGNGEIAKGYFAIDNNINIFPEGAVDTSNPLYCYTFTRLNGIESGYGVGGVTQDNVLDESIQTLGFSSDTYTRCQNNVLGHMKSASHILTNNVFLTISTYNEEVGSYYLPSYGNKIGLNCSNNTFGSDVYGLTFGDGCSYNIICDDCYYNTFGNSCYSNSFGNGCYSNSFGNGCTSNSFGYGCTSNTFGNNCYRNSFGNGCTSNSFGNNCSDNSFGSNCSNNSFENSCESNSFGNGCNSNSFGNTYHGNSFGDGCNSNTFGNDCFTNTFGNDCYSNSFGNDCSNNSFGNDCYSNSFGNDCYSNSFGYNFQTSTLGKGVQYVKVAISETEHVKYVQILNGTQGTDSTNLLEINFVKGAKYSQFAGFKSDGTLKVWVEADIPTDNSSISSL